MASLILAIAALILAGLGLVVALVTWSATKYAQGVADEALDSVALLAMKPDALFLTEDGEEFEFRVDRSN